MSYPPAAPLATPLAAPFGGPVASMTPQQFSLIKAWSGRIATTACFSPTKRPAPRLATSPLRVRQHHVEWVDDRLSDRDRAIMTSVNRLRLVSGPQLERLHFTRLSETSRARVRRRVLTRLADWRVLTPLKRRIGGERAGSDGLVFALDTAGQQLVPRPLGPTGEVKPLRRPYTPRLVWMRHSLAVSELCVALTERARIEAFELQAFITEPACWWPDGLGRWVKSDAYLSLATRDYSDDWWLEQDMSKPDRHSEDLPTIRRKCLTYLDFVVRGQVGPHGDVPRVLFNCTNVQRQAAIRGVIASLPYPASKLLHVTTTGQAVDYLLRVLRA